MSNTHAPPRIGHAVDFFVIDYDGYELRCECGETFTAESRWRCLAMYGVHFQVHADQLRDAQSGYPAPDDPDSWVVTTPDREPAPDPERWP